MPCVTRIIGDITGDIDYDWARLGRLRYRVKEIYKDFTGLGRVGGR